MEVKDVFEKYGIDGFLFVTVGRGWQLRYEELILLSLFRDFTLKLGSWYGTDEELGVIIGRSTRTIRRIKKKMVDFGYIRIENNKVIYNIDEPECPVGLEGPVGLEYIPSENKFEWRTC